MINKLLNILKPIYYEYLSYFVPKKLGYKITGECKKCGKCCTYMYSLDTFDEEEFKIMQFIYPGYKRFYVKGKDAEGNLIFACKLLGEDGLCTDYKKRLPLCKKYPVKKIYYNGKLHEGCGFSIEPEVEFENLLKPKD